MDNLIYHFTTPNTKYVAAFDLDNTLITTKSGKVFPKDKDDYKLLYDNVLDKLKDLTDKNYKIVIFSNQKGIGLGKINTNIITHKINKLFPNADYFLSLKDDLYRKPMIGMYEKFIELNGKPKKMFYVGDAAGRSGDHSYADINFAFNCNIKFYTQDRYFLNIKTKVYHYCPSLPSTPNNISDLKKYNENVIIIMQGFPACGKSTFIKNYVDYHNISDYTHLSNDTHTKSQIKKLIKQSINDEKLIFIDNLNATKKNRKEIIDLVTDNEYNIIGIHITTPMEYSQALNKQRYYYTSKDPNYTYKGKNYKKIPNVAYNVFKKNFQEMTKDEGFYKIIKFLPDIKLDYCFV